jgi:hypothetical protein
VDELHGSRQVRTCRRTRATVHPCNTVRMSRQTRSVVRRSLPGSACSGYTPTREDYTRVALMVFAVVLSLTKRAFLDRRVAWEGRGRKRMRGGGERISRDVKEVQSRGASEVAELPTCGPLSRISSSAASVMVVDHEV